MTITQALALLMDSSCSSMLRWVEVEISSLLLLFILQEPHDRLLCDRLAEGLGSSDKGRTIALDMLGYIVRKQSTWLHRVARHQLIKDLLRLLKTETDVVVLVQSLLVLVSLLPAVKLFVRII